MKYMISFQDEQAKYLERAANKRHVTIQELLRAVIVPEWKEMNGNSRSKGARDHVLLGASPPPLNLMTTPSTPPSGMIEKKAKQE